METAQLKAFLRIAETGSISRAAESLGISQPSLSQQLLRLEDEVGIRLFDRMARGVTLTEGGKVFQEHARNILHAADQAIADARHMRDDARGQVVFAMPPSVARMIGAPLVETLGQTAPLVQVRVVEAFCGTIRGWIEAEKIDLGIVYDLGRLPHLVQRPLVSDELLVIGPKGRFDPLDQGHELPFSKLLGERIVAPGPQHGLRQLLDREAVRHGGPLTFVHEVDSINVMIELVARGHGLAVLPQCAVMEAAWAGQVTLARIAGQGLRRRLSLVRNRAHVLTHASVRVEHLTRATTSLLIDTGGWQALLESEPYVD